jgi:hypothetical protein
LPRSRLVARTDFAKFRRAFIATNLDHAVADLHLDGIRVESAVTGCTGFFGHGTNSAGSPRFGQTQETTPGFHPLSKSLAVFRNAGQTA